MFKGQIINIGQTEVVSDKFKKRDFVVKSTDTQYPQEVSFQLQQDKVNLLDSMEVGQEVTVHYNLNGRSWVNQQGETKWFNTLQCWKIETNGGF